ncbi:MAG: hypothetical protein DMG57_32750 [Acidobacteria bacterium]|nr:MAG: hypothetical protein DMG57_32750 [Acidobacteriota bacterium]
MRMTYDASVDAAYIYVIDHIGAGAVRETHPCEPGGGKGVFNLDFDESGRLLRIEVLGARSILPAEVLNKAEWPSTHAVLGDKR